MVSCHVSQIFHGQPDMCKEISNTDHKGDSFLKNKKF